LWISLTLTNVMHVTTNGSVASWYFFSGSDTEVVNPTSTAFKRAATTSLGSVAFGSFIIAVIRAIRFAINQMLRNRNPLIAW
jgi:hypothetical protein